jgi:hypothetical protein
MISSSLSRIIAIRQVVQYLISGLEVMKSLDFLIELVSRRLLLYSIKCRSAGAKEDPHAHLYSRYVAGMETERVTILFNHGSHKNQYLR